jgi:hypothetical protein
VCPRATLQPVGGSDDTGERRVGEVDVVCPGGGRSRSSVADAAQLSVAALLKAVSESPQTRDALMQSLAALGQSTVRGSDTDAGASVPARRAPDGASTTGSGRTARSARTAD